MKIETIHFFELEPMGKYANKINKPVGLKYISKGEDMQKERSTKKDETPIKEKRSYNRKQRREMAKRKIKCDNCKISIKLSKAWHGIDTSGNEVALCKPCAIQLNAELQARKELGKSGKSTNNKIDKPV